MTVELFFRMVAGLFAGSRANAPTGPMNRKEPVLISIAFSFAKCTSVHVYADRPVDASLTHSPLPQVPIIGRYGRHCQPTPVGSNRSLASVFSL